MSEPTFGNLAGKTAVVTGSSSGIGKAIALELAAAGAACIVHAHRSRTTAEQVADEIRRRGGEAEVVMSDVADASMHQSLVEQAWKWKDAIDVWVNNAGADVLTGEAARDSFACKLERLWRVDVLGTIGLSRLIGERMKARGKGAIIQMGWDQAEQGMAGDSGQLFAASKGAVMAFSKSLAQSLAPEVRVNCVAPGWIKTAWGATASQGWQRRAAAESLAGRWGTPDDVSRTVRFLASDAAEFINGQTIPVNGGFQRS